MEWNCNKCNREIISEKPNKFCLECWWKDLVEKTEITPETIRNFMEKYWVTILNFHQETYSDVLWISSEDTKTLASRRQKEGLDSCYYPQTEKNMSKMMGWAMISVFKNEYTAFLEKLFHFAQVEKIKMIRSNWKVEKNTNNENLFKVTEIIIEKKTAEELAEDLEIRKYKKNISCPL